MAARPGQVLVFKEGKGEPQIVYKAEGIALDAGDLVAIEAGGGGGYGPPAGRPVE